LWVGERKPGRFEPSHALALAVRADAARNRLDLDAAAATRWIAGEPLSSSGDPGWVLVTIDGFPLGWGKRSGSVVKNHYPKGLRRQA
jgi:NOL1/NOP2/fmu family ribosome biogenesis protein